jgi:hypothetical protein
MELETILRYSFAVEIIRGGMDNTSSPKLKKLILGIGARKERMTSRLCSAETITITTSASGRERPLVHRHFKAPARTRVVQIGCIDPWD